MFARFRHGPVRNHDFAELLQQLSTGMGEPSVLIGAWRERHISAAALSRVNLLRRGVVHASGSDRVRVLFPNGETRLMLPGPSTQLSKSVIEEFASRFHIPLGTLRDWEQGRKEPDAAARAYLVVIGRNPAAVSEALHPTVST